MAAVVVALLVPAGVALAGYQNGGFAGTTAQMEAIAFRADDVRVKKLATNVYAECADSTRQRITVEKGRTEVDDDRFSLELSGGSDLKVTVTGRLRGGRAGGRIVATVKPRDTSCKADLRWQATLAKSAS